MLYSLNNFFLILVLVLSFRSTNMELLVKSLKLLTKYLKFCGFFLYAVDNQYKTSRPIFIYGILINVFISTLSIIMGWNSAETYSSFISNASKVTYIVSMVEVFVTNFNVLVIFYVAIFTQEKQMKLFNRMDIFRTEILTQKFSQWILNDFHAEQKKRVNIRLIFIFCSHSLLSMFYMRIYYGNGDNFLDILSSYQIILYLLLILYHFSLITFITQLILMFGTFCEILNINLGLFLNNFEIRNNRQDISQILKLHQDIKNLAQDFLEIFGVIIYSSLIFSFMNFTIQIYNIYLLIFRNQFSLILISYCIINVMWISPMLIAMQNFGSTCAKFKCEFVKTSLLLREFNTNNYVKVFNKFMLTSLENNLELSANGLFIVDGSIGFQVSKLEGQSITLF